jgi:GTP pyrophosphokinase
VKALPRGSTPIDFAFSIHTDVGLHCAGARVNGRIVPLRYELRNGDIVEIVTAATQHPSRDWLKIVKSSRARSRIKAWIKNEERVRSIGLGKELLDRELRKLGKVGRLKLETFPQVLQHYGVASEEDLCAAIGYGKISTRQAVLKLLPPEQAQAIVEEEAKGRGPVIPAAAEGIRIDGVDDILVHFGKCCNPLPGDEIIGFITRGRGVTIHSADCPNIIAFRFDRERQIAVQWDDRVKMPHQVKILVTIGEDRPGLLAEISTAISSTNTNIAQAEIKVTEDKRGMNTFVLEVVDLKQLQFAMQAIRRVRGVMGVERIRKH